jgi:ABC-type lipoprotein release transport system permease subunit
VALALFVGLAAGAVLAFTAAARRTDTAYERFLTSQRGYDVLVPLTRTQFSAEGELETDLVAVYDAADVRELPEVADAAEFSSFFVSVGAGVGVMLPKDDSIGSKINEFKLLEGRRPDPEEPTEVVVGFEYANQYGVGVGDTIPLIDAQYFEPPPPGIDPETVDDIVARRDRILEIAPDNQLHIVGIEASPGEFPPQIEGTGRYIVHASPALYPYRAELGALSEAGDALMVRLRNGEADVDRFLRGLDRLGGGGDADVLLQRDFTAPVDRSLHTQAVALQLLALLAAIVAALVLGQLLARLTFVESSDHRTLAALGLSPGQRFGLGLLRAAAIAVAAIPVTLVLATLLSPIFPVGLARTAEPAPGIDVDPAVFALGALVVVVLVVLLAAWPSWRASRAGAATATAPPTRVSFASRLSAARSVPLPVSTGVRMALDPGSGRSAVPVLSSLVGVTLGIVTLVATITFGACLAHLLDTPALYGKSWDVEVTTYDGTLASSRGEQALSGDRRIEGVATGNFRISFSVDGRQVDGLAIDQRSSDFNPTILEGRPPRTADEVVLGTRTMREAGVGIGDRVRVGLYTIDRRPLPMRVVGRAVFPVFGITGQLGDGALVNVAGARRISRDLADPEQTSVLVRLADGTDPERLAGELSGELDTNVFLITQGAPSDILNFGRVEATPYILGAFLAVLATATLALLLASATRRRRRELAVLKTLGFQRAQVRATVAWQATTLAVVALVVGVPLGIAVGRWAWTLFADQLGVVVVTPTPWLPVLLLIPAGVLVANLVAAVPAASAARTRPAVVLRAE